MNNHECNRLCFLSENNEIDVLLLVGGRDNEPEKLDKHVNIIYIRPKFRWYF
jgi:hypothetical protein